MNSLLTALPFLISFLIGYLLILVLHSKKETMMAPGIHIFLAGGLGLGISAQLTFLSFFFFNTLDKTFVIALNLTLLLFLIFLTLIVLSRRKPHLFFSWNTKDLFPYLLLILFSFPLCYNAMFFAHGGWDAWSTWNLKSKILFMAGEDWRKIFDPILWRSSPHYPLQLPLTNLWGWIFLDEINTQGPITTGLIFALSLVGLLYTGLKELTGSKWAFLPSLVLLSLPVFVTLSLSQYADHIIGYYLLASIFCLIMTRKNQSLAYAVLTGLFLGFMAFTKNEGFLLSNLILLCSFIYLLYKTKFPKKILLILLATFAIVSLTNIVFNHYYAPENQTFINGFTTDNPLKRADIQRLQNILKFYAVELGIGKWNGLWIILLAGAVLSWKRSFNWDLIIIPIIVSVYLLIVTVYYLQNTYFEIFWWLQVTLHRVLFVLLPVICFWVSLAVLQKDK